MIFNKLTDEEKRIIENKGTEKPFSGDYDSFFPTSGVFVCRKCDNLLFDSRSKFDAGCGWPAFDDYFTGAVDQIADDDGFRTEIQCSKCKGHLGHVFKGENFTNKNTRHCVNSLSIKFVPDDTIQR